MIDWSRRGHRTASSELDDVISWTELEGIAEQYRKVAGFARDGGTS